MKTGRRRDQYDDQGADVLYISEAKAREFSRTGKCSLTLIHTGIMKAYETAVKSSRLIFRRSLCERILEHNRKFVQERKNAGKTEPISHAHRCYGIYLHGYIR